MDATFGTLEKPTLEERIRGLISSAIEHATLAESRIGDVLCFCDRRSDEADLNVAKSAVNSITEKLYGALGLLTELNHRHLNN
jgi:hypothetical protein